MVEASARSGLSVRQIAPAYRQVADQLRTLILNGDLAPGARLPSEPELSTMFGVSRSTVREALRSLSSQNLITTTRGVTGGSVVAHPDPQHISEFLETSIGLLSGNRRVTVPELLEVRHMLEVPAARLAATRRSAEDVETLRRTIGEERVNTARADESFEGHRAFHTAILNASGNALLEIVTRPIFQVIATRFRREQAPRNFWTTVHNDHERILRSIEEQDADGAAAAMGDHLRHLATTYERIDAERE
jgi:GntR family transcriptional repressor for pyruvate dehydrogenase complex